jgi:uncharacterized protein with HEPN domain
VTVRRHFFALDQARVWHVAVRDVPTLRAQICEIIARETGRAAEPRGRDLGIDHSV